MAVRQSTGHYVLYSPHMRDGRVVVVNPGSRALLVYISLNKSETVFESDGYFNKVVTR